MKLQKKYLIITFLLIATILLFISQKALANNKIDSLYMQEYTDEFKNWLNLFDEEKEKVLMPKMYEVEPVNISSKNPLYLAKTLRASMNSKYSLKDVIPNNLAIRNQEHTNSCWVFASLSSLETNLALYNYRNSVNLSKVYDFSERHMEYATSKTFENGIINENGYNREVGSGGSYQISHAYLTNGSGAVDESEMPFEDNENTIDISEIQNKEVSSQVYDTTFFPDYNLYSGETKTEIMNQIKQHIQNYGSVEAGLHGGSSDTLGYTCFNNDTGAKFCDNTDEHPIDHDVSIIGWDDNYSIDNFSENARPTSNGAWIVRNSWGERIEESLSELKQEIYDESVKEGIETNWNSAEDVPNAYIEFIGYTIEGDKAYMKYGDNGIIYVSYEDVNISKQMAGIVKATDNVNYDYIYQYDNFFPIGNMVSTNPDVMLSNIFKKQSTAAEYLTQVMLYVYGENTCKVYVNPNGTSTASKDLQLVQLKAGETETISNGYHTLEFAEPIEINSNEFAVVVEIHSTSGYAIIPLEGKNDKMPIWDSVEIENGKCFMALGNDLDNCQWYDLGKINEQNASLANGDSTIKAFTTSQVWDNSLKNIEIETQPNKTSYIEGENFDKTGMVVIANYNSETSPTVILDDNSYNIVNGTNLKAGQTSVTITYENMSVEQPITVEENIVTGITIKTPPSKTEYLEGENFDSTGMVVEASYKDGSKKEIKDYVIENGDNLKANQNQVTISYGDKSISQAILVTANSLEKIEITTPPDKTEYVVGQNFDKTGMVVTGTYQNGARNEIINYTIENGTNLSVGQSVVIISYEGKTTSQPITVEEKTITGITITKNPNKMEYIQNKENIDLTGGLLRINYNDNSSENIDLASDQIEVTGFDNTKVGTNTITIKYQNYTTTLNITIVEEEVNNDQGTTEPEEKPENSDSLNGNCVVDNVKLYMFTDKSEQEYLTMDITIDNINRNMNANDSLEYYYYLSPSQNESNIQGWVKIDSNQDENDKLIFTVNTKDIKNYEEIKDSNTVYIYIREVAKKGGNQSVLISKPILIDSDYTMEVYLDNVKTDNINTGNNNNSNAGGDETTAPGKLPQTGVRNIAVILLVVLAIGGIIFFIRYKKLSKYVK